MSKTTNKFSPEVRERAVRLVLDNEVQHPSRWQAVMSISAKIGCTPQTLNDWVKKAEVDSGRRAGIPTEMAERMKALERENRDQQLHDPGLLRREQLAPDVLERLQRGDHVGLGEGVLRASVTPDHRDYAALMGTVVPQFSAAPAQGHALQQPTTATQPSQPASAPGAAGRPSWAQ